MYHVDVDLIAKLEPDLIITQDHCSVCAVSLADVERALCAVTKKQTRVCTLHPNTWSDVLRDIQRVADAAGVSTRADTVIRQMEQRLHNLERVVTEHLAGASGPRVALLEWLEPPMLAGCWMPELARRAGCVPVQTTEGAAFEVIDWETLHALDPDVVVMSPCGYTVEKTLSELEGASLAEPLRALRAVREGRAFVADGNALFSRPGPRLVETAYLLANAAHPDCALDLSKEIRALLVPWG